MNTYIGRDEKPIDWELVDVFLEAGCFGTEIAPHFDMHVKTFYRRIEEKYGMTFAEYSAFKNEHGLAKLRLAQYEKALAKDNTMMIWLGKHRLNQKEEKANINIISQNSLSDILEKNPNDIVPLVKEQAI